VIDTVNGQGFKNNGAGFYGIDSKLTIMTTGLLCQINIDSIFVCLKRSSLIKVVLKVLTELKIKVSVYIASSPVSPVLIRMT